MVPCGHPRLHHPRADPGTADRIIPATDGYRTAGPVPRSNDMSGEPYVITEACIDVTDRACVDVCPVQCIYELEGDELVARDEVDGPIVNRHPPHPELRFLYGDSMLYIQP